jgi:carbonic anhydrase
MISRQTALTSQEALVRLREGNFRFVHHIRQSRDLIQQVLQTATSQSPFAAIVSCMDSRTSNELIFDLGIGDIFSIRIAGNVMSPYVLGSLEFACKISTARFIVVLGHTGCGAIKGACDEVKLGNLSALLQTIRPAVDEEGTVAGNRNSGNDAFTYKVAKLNAEKGIAILLKESPILQAMLVNGEIGIIAAMYHVETGMVEFLEETLMLNAGN